MIDKKALNVTDLIQVKNPVFRQYQLGVKLFSLYSFPSRFNGIENVSSHYQDRTDLHEKDGFWEVEEKQPLGLNQKYGAIAQKGKEKKYHYPIVDKTPEEIRSEIMNASESNRQIIIDEAVRIQNENAITEVFDAITDPLQLLDNLDAFPLWEPDTFYKKDRKVKHFTNQELKLFKIGQDHKSLSIYPPDAKGV